MFRFLTITIATIAIAYASWSNAASALYSKYSPATGLRFNPNSATALINTTSNAGAAKDKMQFLRIARPHAVKALKSEPLASEALRQLGQYYALTGHVAKGRDLIELSSKLSRRDSQTQLWLAEDGLRNDRTMNALRSLDVVLRTQPNTREASFQAMGSLLGDAEFRSIFVKYMGNRPPWLKQFIEFNIQTLKQPQALSQTLTALRPFPRDLLTDATSGQLLTSLVNQAPIQYSKEFYEHIPGSDSKVLTSLSFPRPTDALRLPPFGWELLSDNNVQGFADIDGDTVSIGALATPGRRGMAARKILFLTSGNYRWTGTTDLSEMRDRATASVNVLCNVGPGRWTRLSGRDLTVGTNSIEFAVGAKCRAQLLTIETVGSESQADASMTITAMRLVPIETRGAARTATAKSD